MMMKKKFKLNSIAGRSGLYSFISFGFAMLILIIIFLWTATRQIRGLIEIDNVEQIQTIVRAFDQSIKENLRELREYANSATLVNAVMDPDNTRYYLPDYIDDIDLHQISGDYLLLTFDGCIIYSTSSAYICGQVLASFPELVEHIEDGKWIQFQEETLDVLFSAEIQYNGFTEGYLLFVSDFTGIFNYNKYLFDTRKNDRVFSALYNGIVINETERAEYDYISTVFPLETIPVNMQVGTSTKRIREPVQRILYQIILVSSIAILLLSVLFSIITSRNLIMPLLALENGIKQIGMGNWQILHINERDPIEIQFLRRSFNSMQESLREKTCELEDSNSKLKKTNTNLINTQKQLVHSEKMASIGQLAAGVAHEINNPTGFVSTNLQTMTEYLDVYKKLFHQMDEMISSINNEKAEDEYSEILKTIELIKDEEDFPFILEDSFHLLEESLDGASRIKKIVQDLRNFARPESQDFRLADITVAIEDALRLTNNELKYKCEVVKELVELPKILCRIDQLTQVFVNLFVNAVQAIDDHGILTVKSDMDSEFIIVTVCDTGSGISKGDIPKLFDPFFTTKDVGKGTGLGLAISYGIIEKHSGTIEVSSTPGEGTCFLIKIPYNRTQA